MEKKISPGMLKDWLHPHDKIRPKNILLHFTLKNEYLGWLGLSILNIIFFKESVNLSEQTIFGERFILH